ncbi:MAG: hypothetical protein RIC19_23975 [Phaeodactylibacter sp.]|uniref:hypothetical protein n=1 Tax=Phaeodactylibacter sp. TaxID=1940289 RepID=UPI0032EE2B99
MASILLALYILLVRGSVFFVPVDMIPQGAGPFSIWIYDWIGYSGQLPAIVAMLLLLIQGFYLNYLVMEHRLATEVSLFPGVFYVLVSSLLPSFHYLSPVLMGNTFFLIVAGEVFATYKKNNTADRIFNIGFWSGVGFLFYPSFLLLLLFGFTGLNILRAFKISERLMALTGLFVPVFLVGAWGFWNDWYPAYTQLLVSSFEWLSYVASAPARVYRDLGMMSVLVLVVLFSHRSYMLKQNIEVQRKINILYWGLLIFTLSLLFQSHIQLDHLMVLAAPVGLLLSLNFVRMPGRMAEVLHLLLLVIALALQFQPMIFPNT